MIVFGVFAFRLANQQAPCIHLLNRYRVVVPTLRKLFLLIVLFSVTTFHCYISAPLEQVLSFGLEANL